MKGKSVFLFGAGATIDWNSPTTAELTTLILSTGFKTTDNQRRITQFIYDTLIENNFEASKINFETIINVIDELSLYYSKFDKNSTSSSILKCFLNPLHEEQLLNFSVVENANSNRFTLQIPKGKEYPFFRFVNYNQTPTEFFFQLLINSLLSDISARISEYAYYSEGHSTIDFNNESSTEFSKWMLKKHLSSMLRLYTLNYERIFKHILKKSGLDLFEGFFEMQDTYLGKLARADVPKIHTDLESDIFYNLHGSAFWQVSDLDNHQLNHAEILLSDYPHLQMNDSPATIQIEKGKSILLTNIITGFQKTQRGMISPFRQMQSSFDRDCCFADEIFIIGYSFSDEHINQSIKAAIRYNSKVKITIVDPYFIKNNMDEHFALNLFPFKNKGYHEMHPLKVNDTLFSYFDGDFLVHTKSFTQFLKQENSV